MRSEKDEERCLAAELIGSQEPSRGCQGRASLGRVLGSILGMSVGSGGTPVPECH